MNDVPAKPDLTIVLELRPPLSNSIVDLAAEYCETPQQTVHRLLFASICTREALALAAEALNLLAGDKPDDEEGR